MHTHVTMIDNHGRSQQHQWRFQRRKSGDTTSWRRSEGMGTVPQWGPGANCWSGIMERSPWSRRHATIKIVTNSNEFRIIRFAKKTGGLCRSLAQRKTTSGLSKYFNQMHVGQIHVITNKRWVRNLIVDSCSHFREHLKRLFCKCSNKI